MPQASASPQNHSEPLEDIRKQSSIRDTSSCPRRAAGRCNDEFRCASCHVSENALQQQQLSWERTSSCKQVQVNSGVPHEASCHRCTTEAQNIILDSSLRDSSCCNRSLRTASLQPVASHQSSAPAAAALRMPVHQPKTGRTKSSNKLTCGRQMQTRHHPSTWTEQRAV